MESIPTLTQRQAEDYISSQCNTLLMTVERQTTHSDFSFNDADSKNELHRQSFRQPHFCTVHARPFECGTQHETDQKGSTNALWSPPFDSISKQKQSNEVSHFIPNHKQSKTFTMLQNVMHNTECMQGAAALPAPRSASLDQMKMHRQRVKIFMPQTYNSPMGMYSAHNVLESFTAQADSALGVVKRN